MLLYFVLLIHFSNFFGVIFLFKYFYFSIDTSFLYFPNISVLKANLTKNGFRGTIVYVIKGGSLCKIVIEGFLIV